MRLLWSYMHEAAVQQHGAGAWSAARPASGSAKRGRKPVKAAAAAAAVEAAAEASQQQQKQTAGDKRKASGAASEAAAGKKAKGASGGAAAGSGKQQKQQRKQAQADEEAAAASSKPSKKRKQAKSSSAAAGDGRGDSSQVVIGPPLSADDPQLQDEQLMKYGTPIAGEGLKRNAEHANCKDIAAQCRTHKSRRGVPGHLQLAGAIAADVWLLVGLELGVACRMSS
jgi:hypothetical protein